MTENISENLGKSKVENSVKETMRQDRINSEKNLLQMLNVDSTIFHERMTEILNSPDKAKLEDYWHNQSEKFNNKVRDPDEIELKGTINPLEYKIPNETPQENNLVDEIKDEKLKIGMSYAEVYNSLPTKDELVAQKMSQLMKGNPEGDMVCVNDLLTVANEEDIKKVLEQNPKNITKIMPGKTSLVLARCAEKSNPIGTGKCGKGTSDIIQRALGQNIRTASACNLVDKVVEQGDFFSVSYPNLAYTGKRKKYASSVLEDQNKMRAWNDTIPSGAIISIANKDKNDRKEGNAGEIHGHAYVRGLSPNKNVCDHVEFEGPNFKRYGKEVHIAFSKDSNISKDMAQKIVEQSIERQIEEGKLAAKPENSKIAYNTRNNKDNDR